jgi:hypothetical protein
MAIKPNRDERPKTSIWRILGAVLGVTVLAAYMFHHANFVTGRSLLLAFPGWEVTYRSCWPNPFGGAWASDVTLMPFEGDEEDAFHFDHLTVDVPFFQFYRSGWSKRLRTRLEAISEIRLEFSGGHGQMSLPFSSELHFFGTASASPFEADGCVEDDIWISDELEDMGLTAEPTTLGMAWIREDDSLVKEQYIHAPGAGRVDYREVQVMHDDFPLFSLIETGANELTRSEWHVRDEGFVVARNRYCAGKDGIDEKAFVTRHVDTVQRLIAALGLHAEATTEQAYRRFAAEGGTLDLVLDYSPAIDAAVYEEEDFGRWLARTRGELTVDGRSQRLAMDIIPVRPFAEEDDELTTFAVLRKERNAHAAAEAVAGEAAAETTTAVERGAASPATASGAPARQTTEVEAPLERPDTITDYRQLAAEAGQRFKLYTKGKSAMRVEVVGMQDGLVKVRRHLRSGWLEYTVARAAFERAERIR